MASESEKPPVNQKEKDDNASDSEPGLPPLNYVFGMDKDDERPRLNYLFWTDEDDLRAAEELKWERPKKNKKKKKKKY